MNPLDEFIERVTRRLKPDGELAAEVGHELRTHIEEAAEEARASGMSEEQSQDHALKRFGDADQVADQLWAANVRRMRLRNVGKWAFRLVAAPAALLLALVLLWDGVDFLAYVRLLRSDNDILQSLMSAHPLMATKYPKAVSRRDLTEKERAILEAGNLEWGERGAKLVELSPENPMFRAIRINEYLAELDRTHQDDDRTNPDPTHKTHDTSLGDEIRQGLALADDGERVDPENAFFNYMKAILLMEASDASEIEDAPYLTYTQTTRPGRSVEQKVYRIEILSQNLFEEGLAEFWKGVAKPRCDPYVMEFQRYLHGLERRPGTLLGVSQRVAVDAGLLLPYLAKLRDLNRLVVGHAIELAESGDKAGSAGLLAAAPVPGTQLGCNNESGFIDLLVAYAMRAQALAGARQLYEKMEMHAAVERTEREEEKNEAAFNDRWDSEEERTRYDLEVVRSAGIIGHEMFPAIDVEDDTVFAPVRHAERAVFDRMAVGGVALAFLIEFLIIGIAVMARSWWGRKGTVGPGSFFIGWRRLTVILLVGVLLPIVAYAAFVRSPWGSMQYSISYVPARVVCEMIVGALATMALVNILGYRAIRARMRELGIQPEDRRRGRAIFSAAFWTIGIVGLLIAVLAWNTDSLQNKVAVVFGGAALLGLLDCLVASATDATKNRNLLPVLAAALLALALVARFPLRAAEANAVAKIEVEGRRLLLDEVEYSRIKAYRVYLQSLPNNGRLEIGTEGQ